MTKRIRSDQPYVGQTFNQKDFVKWGYPYPQDVSGALTVQDATGGLFTVNGLEMFSGRLAGCVVTTSGSGASATYYCASGSFFVPGDYASGSNSGLTFEQSASVSVVASATLGSASSGVYVFYGYCDTISGPNQATFGVCNVTGTSATSGKSFLASGIASTDGVVYNWTSLPLVSVAGHVHEPVSAHIAHAIGFDNTYKQLEGDPTNVQDAIEAIPIIVPRPPEIVWFSTTTPFGFGDPQVDPPIPGLPVFSSGAPV